MPMGIVSVKAVLFRVGDSLLPLHLSRQAQRPEVNMAYFYALDPPAVH